MRSAAAQAALDLVTLTPPTEPRPGPVLDPWGVGPLRPWPARPHPVRNPVGGDDTRAYRCTCGEWRYRFRLGRWHRTQPPCPACGAP